MASLAGLAEEIHGREIHAGTPAYMAPEQLAGKEVTLVGLANLDFVEDFPSLADDERFQDVVDSVRERIESV